MSIHGDALGRTIHAITANPNEDGTPYTDLAERDADTAFNTNAKNINKVVRVETDPPSFYVLISTVPAWDEFGSTGSVSGSGIVIDTAVARFNGITGDVIEGSNVFIDDAGSINVLSTGSNFSPPLTINTLGTDGGTASFRVGDVVPTVPGTAGSIYHHNNQIGPGALYLNTSTISGNSWDQLLTLAASASYSGQAGLVAQVNVAETGIEFGQALRTTDSPTFLDLILTGDLTVQGATTFLDTTTLQVEDKNIELGKVPTPTDLTADGGGITLLGDTNKTILWDNATDSWQFNQNSLFALQATIGSLASPGTDVSLFLSDSTKAFKPNSGTTAQKDAITEEGAVYYDETLQDMQFRNSVTWQAMGGGDVSGPPIAIDNSLMRADGTSGKAIQDSVAVLSDTGVLSGVNRLEIGNLVLATNVISTALDIDLILLPGGNGHIGLNETMPQADLHLARITGPILGRTFDPNATFIIESGALDTESNINMIGGTVAKQGFVFGRDIVSRDGSFLYDNVAQAFTWGASGDVLRMTLGSSGVLTLTNQLDAGTNKLVNVVDPTAAQDAATKAYVDLVDTGDVVGPSSSTDNALARFDGITGGLIQNSLATLDDAGNLDLTNANSAYEIGGNPVLFADATEFNTLVGVGAGGSPAIASFRNVAVGFQALLNIVSGTEHTAVGYQALLSNTDGFFNTAVGFQALTSNTDGTSNTAIGHLALASNVQGGRNTAIGQNALRNNVGGEDNVAIGSSALLDNVSGDHNLAIGFQALRENLGFFNIAVGDEGLRDLVTGNSSTAIGRRAGRFIADGSTSNTQSVESLFLGAEARSLDDTVTTNEIVIGFQAIGLGSNSVVLGNSSIVKTLLRGKVGIDTTAPLSQLDIQGDLLDGDSLLRLGTSRAWEFQQELTGSNTALRLRNTVGLNKSFFIDTNGITAFRSQDGTSTSMTIDHSTGQLIVDNTVKQGAVTWPNSTNTAALGFFHLYQCSAVTTNRTLTISSADIANSSFPNPWMFMVKDRTGTLISNSTTITIATEGAETIDGATSVQITADFGIVRLYSDGSNLFSW